MNALAWRVGESKFVSAVCLRVVVADGVWWGVPRSRSRFGCLKSSCASGCDPACGLGMGGGVERSVTEIIRATVLMALKMLTQTATMSLA